MISISDQIAHEKKGAELSAEQFYFKQDELRDSNRGDEVDAVRSIMRQRIEEVGRTIESLSKRKGGHGGKYNRLITTVATFDGETDFNVLAYLGIKSIFQGMGKEDGSDWVSVATSIAHILEFEHKTRKFETENPGYYHAVMNSMADQQVTSQTHIRKVLSKKMTDFNMEWTAWDSNTKIQIANKILLAIMHNLDDVFFRAFRYHKKKSIATIATTPLADDWLAEFEAERGYLNPMRLPTLIPPREWVDNDGIVTGGYYSYRLSRELVKAYTPHHKAFLQKHDMKAHISAINKMQATKWCINKQVFEVQRQMFIEGLQHPGIPSLKRIEIPAAPAELEGLTKDVMNDDQLKMLDEWKDMAKALNRADRTRRGKTIQFKMSYDVARMYLDYESFHYVYTADFRGRIYADTTGLSPQSNDTSKALLQFAMGKEVTQSGIFWLAVHGANTFGNDKISYQDRVNWIYEQEHIYRQIVENPVDNRTLWADADKPWQYLAFIFAWADVAYGYDASAKTYIPIGLDGSCNGLQHYSALLRDQIGGAGVNLTDADIPSDIYADVSARLEANLQSMGADPQAQRWLSTGLGRKLTKRPVMTLPYGSTQTSAREYLYEWAMEREHLFPGLTPRDIYQECIWLTPYLWEAIGQVVIAARVAMDWIQSRTTKLVRTDGQAITWVSPSGFPVYQPYMVQDTTEVITRTAGGIRIKVSMSEDTDTVSSRKQRSGIAPNFVHSLDSSHMVMTINATDFQDYAMIHDDFGTHAADTGDLWKAIREQFVVMYTESDPLRDWSSQQGAYDGDYPEVGELDINQVLTSEYFFG